MKTSVIIFILFVITLGGCGPSAYQKLQNADTSAMKEECRRMEGKKVEAAYKKWGSPEKVTHSGEYKVLKYMDHLSYQGFLVTLKHHVFVKNGIIKICKFRYNASK